MHLKSFFSSAVLKLSHASEHGRLDPGSGVPGSADLGRGLRIHTSNRFPGEAPAADLDTMP